MANRPDVRDRLIPILPLWSPEPITLCALFSGPARLSPKVQVLLDFLGEYIGTDRDPRLHNLQAKGLFTDPKLETNIWALVMQPLPKEGHSRITANTPNVGVCNIDSPLIVSSHCVGEFQSMCECGRRTSGWIGLIAEVHCCDKTVVHREYVQNLAVRKNIPLKALDELVHPDKGMDRMTSATATINILTAETLLNNWQGHRRVTRKTLEAFPEEKLFQFSVGGILLPIPQPARIGENDQLL